jgi:hypothetical protein
MASTKTPSVAFLPAADRPKGWTWMMPSAWEWMPFGSF